MKKLVAALLAIALSAVIFPSWAWADEAATLVAQGAKVFSANCAACHMNGGNVVAAPKNLKQDTLKQYGMDSADAIIKQVTYGKNAMPAFKGRLNENQIQAVAAYVLDRAGKGWK